LKILSIFLIVLCAFLNAQSVNSIESDFTQTITSAEGDTIKYTGNFQALSDGGDNFALWNYKSPIKKKMYFTNNEVVMIEPDLEQAVVTSIDETPDISSILSEAIKTNKKTNNDVSVTVLEVEYKISFSNALPVKLSYTDKLDNKIDIALTKTTLNRNIDKLTFKPEVPKGFDIVRY